MACALGAFYPAQVIAQLAFTLRVAHCGLLQCLPGLPCTLQALHQLLSCRLRSAQCFGQHGITLRRLELEIVGLDLASRQHRLQHLLAAPLGSGIVRRHRQHGQEPLCGTFQLLSLKCALCLPQALVDRPCQGLLAGGKIGVACIEQARALQRRSGFSQFPASGQGARVLQQIAQCILAPFQSGQVVRLQCQDALEQRQRTAVAIVQPAGRERIAGLGQQRADTGAGATPRLQLAGHGVGVALRHLQLAGQRQ